MRQLALCVAPTQLVVLVFVNAAVAINLVRDDSGNDASTEWSISGNRDADILPDLIDDLLIGVDALGVNMLNAANEVTIVDQHFTTISITLGNAADIVSSTD